MKLNEILKNKSTKTIGSTEVITIIGSISPYYEKEYVQVTLGNDKGEFLLIHKDDFIGEIELLPNETALNYGFFQNEIYRFNINKSTKVFIVSIESDTLGNAIEDLIDLQLEDEESPVIPMADKCPARS